MAATALTVELFTCQLPSAIPYTTSYWCYLDEATISRPRAATAADPSVTQKSPSSYANWPTRI